MGKLVHAAFAAFTIAGSVIYANAQTARNSVSGAEVNGTYRMPFTGKFKDSSNKIRILALGKGKVRVAFDLLYPYMMSDGGPMVNLGNAEGTAEITGDTAVFASSEGSCRITIKFARPGTINVSQEGTDADCGFGVNVTADGVYRKTSSKKPRF